MTVRMKKLQMSIGLIIWFEMIWSLLTFAKCTLIVSFVTWKILLTQYHWLDMEACLQYIDYSRRMKIPLWWCLHISVQNHLPPTSSTSANVAVSSQQQFKVLINKHNNQNSTSPHKSRRRKKKQSLIHDIHLCLNINITIRDAAHLFPELATTSIFFPLNDCM